MKDRTSRFVKDPPADSLLSLHQKRPVSFARSCSPHIHCTFLTALLAAVCCALMLCGCGAFSSSSESSPSSAPSASSESSGPDKDYTEQLKLGDQALMNGDIEGALAAYQEAIKINPDVPQAYHRIFDTYVRDQRYDDALVFVRKSYSKIDTDAVRKSKSEKKEYVYVLEGSLYDGMTSSEEEADLLTGFLDLGTHYASNSGFEFPPSEMTAAMAHIEESYQELDSPGLTDLYTKTVSLGEQYSSILQSIKQAGFVMPGNQWNKSPSELSYGIYTNTESAESFSLETVQSFEAELRKLLEEDPDLIFIYLDIASLYIQANDLEHAQEVYLEGVQALQKMQTVRGYASLTAETLFKQAMANVYHKSFLAASAIINRSGSGFTFYEEESSGPDNTPEGFQAEIDAIYQESESISLPKKSRNKLTENYQDFRARIQECFDEVSGFDLPSTDTSIEGEAVLLASTPSITFYPSIYNSDTGWLYLTSITGKEVREHQIIIGTKSKSMLIGEEGAEPVICSDEEIIFEWRECETGERTSNLYLYGNDGSDVKADLYMVTYDPDGKKTGEEKILDYPDVDSDALISLAENAMNSALSGHNRISNNPWKRLDVRVTEDSAVIQTAGVTLRRPYEEEDADRMYYSNCYFDESDGLLVVNWYNGGTEIYRLK